MKNSSARERFYFSAYPLKSVPADSSEASSQNSTLHISNKTKATGRLRVFPMANPYKKEIKPTPRIKPGKMHEDIDANSNGWYGNYE
jgi:hypothetical protein